MHAFFLVKKNFVNLTEHLSQGHLQCCTEIFQMVHKNPYKCVTVGMSNFQNKFLSVT